MSIVKMSLLLTSLYMYYVLPLAFAALECLTSLRPALSYRPLAKQAAEVAHSAGHRTWICEAECLPLHLGWMVDQIQGESNSYCKFTCNNVS